MKATPGKETHNVDTRRQRVVKVIICQFATLSTKNYGPQHSRNDGTIALHEESRLSSPRIERCPAASRRPP